MAQSMLTSIRLQAQAVPPKTRSACVLELLVADGEISVPTFECPTCRTQFSVKRNEEAPYRPFCCRRCKMVDLGRWLDGTYKITEPAKPEDLEEVKGKEEPADNTNGPKA